MTRGMPQAAMVDLWKVPLWLDTDAQRILKSVLSDEELERASNFRFEHLRRRFIVRRAAYRHILAQYVSADPSSLQFTVNDYGKPSLTHMGIQHSTSHSGDLAVLAVTPAIPIGVDLEAVRDLGALYEWLSPDERRQVEQLPPERRSTESLRFWTRKEACAKALGRGMSLLGPDMRLRGDTDDVASVVIMDLRAIPHHVASLASLGTTPRITIREWHIKT